MGFFDMFDVRLRANGFTVQRLSDAIAHVIDTCPYPTPSLANFINFDKVMKHRTYAEMCQEVLHNEAVWNNWLAIKYPDMPKVVWVHANDIATYNLERYIVKKK